MNLKCKNGLHVKYSPSGRYVCLIFTFIILHFTLKPLALNSPAPDPSPLKKKT